MLKPELFHSQLRCFRTYVPSTSTFSMEWDLTASWISGTISTSSF